VVHGDRSVMTTTMPSGGGAERTGGLFANPLFQPWSSEGTTTVVTNPMALPEHMDAELSPRISSPRSSPRTFRTPSGAGGPAHAVGARRVSPGASWFVCLCVWSMVGGGVCFINTPVVNPSHRAP